MVRDEETLGRTQNERIVKLTDDRARAEGRPPDTAATRSAHSTGRTAEVVPSTFRLGLCWRCRTKSPTHTFVIFAAVDRPELAQRDGTCRVSYRLERSPDPRNACRVHRSDCEGRSAATWFGGRNC